MTFRPFFLLAAFALVSCTHQPVVFDPKDKSQEATGSISKLSDYLPKGQGKVKVILVHGVGDHCPGYGLDPEYGWLNAKIANAIGLIKKDENPSNPTHILDYKFTGKTSDPILRDTLSRVSVVKQNFTYKAIGASETSEVEVIEITWSELTQWLKSKQVGYDLTHSLKDATNIDKKLGCLHEIEEGAGKPPHRVLVNRMVKEQVLDRNLLDAVIYAGSYGINLQKGFAEALCTSLSSVPPESEARCDWSKIPDDKNTRYIFITHSLGSRILFDTLLGLDGVMIRPGLKDPIFSDKNAGTFIENMLAQTSVVYMMANQLSILGLANTPQTLSSLDPPIPIKGNLPPGVEDKIRKGLLNSQPPVVTPYNDGKGNENPVNRLDSQNETSNRGLAAQEAINAEEGSVASTEYGTCPINLLIKVAAIKSRVIGNVGHRNLHIVSFNDTNDLLTWAVPSWYQNLPECAPNLKIVNAFVQNTQPWLIFANPLNAHGGYFENPYVWDLMRCGAEHGTVASCKSR
jgi:hypothetical protein